MGLLETSWTKGDSQSSTRVFLALLARTSACCPTCHSHMLLGSHAASSPRLLETFHDAHLPGRLLPALTERGRCFRVWWKHSCWQSSDQSWACLCDRARASRVSWRCSLRRGLEPSPSAACACRHPSLRLSPTSWAETVPSEIPCTGHFISL